MPGKDKGPELKKFVGKRLCVKINGNRVLTGILTGYDVFMNLTLEQAQEEVSPTEKHELGVTVRELVSWLVLPVGELSCPSFRPHSKAPFLPNHLSSRSSVAIA